MDSNTPGGSGAGGNGTSGSQPSGGSGGGSGAGQVNNPNLSGAGGSNVIELSEDSMVKLPGAKDPVRYGDHYKGFQSEFTKRAQEAAALRAEKAKLTAQIQDQQRRLQAQHQPQQGQQNQQSKLAELGAELKSLTYLNGEQAANVVNHVMQEIGGLTQELSRR